MGIVMKNGIDRTKNTVASSIGANAKYIVNPRAKNMEVSRGKMPATIIPNKIISST